MGPTGKKPYSGRSTIPLISLHFLRPCPSLSDLNCCPIIDLSFESILYFCLNLKLWYKSYFLVQCFQIESGFSFLRLGIICVYVLIFFLFGKNCCWTLTWHKFNLSYILEVSKFVIFHKQKRICFKFWINRQENQLLLIFSLFMAAFV